MKFSILSLVVACLVGAVHGNLCDFVLDAESLQTSVFDTNRPALVAFVKSEEDNGATSQLMEASVASLGELGFCVSTFDCSDAKHAKQCSITAGRFPLLALYLDEPKKNPYTKKNYREYLPHLPHDNSKESSRKIDKFVATALGADRISVAENEDEVASLLAAAAVASTPQVLLLSSKTQTSLLWRSVAFHFRGRLQFAQIKADRDGSDASSLLLKNSLGEVTVPSVLLRAKGEGSIDRFSGDAKSFAEVVAWLAPHAGPAAAAAAAPSSGDDETPAQDNAGKTSMRAISAAEFSELLTDATREDVHVVAVTRASPDDEHHQPQPDLAALQKKCYGAVLCVQFDCPGEGAEGAGLDEAVARFCPAQGSAAGGIPADPYLLVVPYSAADRTKLLAVPSKFILKSSGGVFSAEVQASAAKKAQDSFPEALVAVIDESQMQSFLGACMQEQVFGILVLASPGKTSAPAMLRHVAAAHKEMTKIAYVSDPSTKFLQQFGMTDPTLPSALALVQPASGDQFQVMYYDPVAFGAMNFRSLTSFVYNVVEGAPGLKEAYLKKMQAKQQGAAPPPESAPAAGPAVLTHVTSQQQWAEQCGTGFKGICAVGFVGAPDLSTGEYDAASVAMFESLMNSLSHHMRASFRFVWLDIACQADLALNFDLNPDFSPGLVMYSPLKKRYATYMGNFKQDSLSAFASGMLSSKVRTFPIRGENVLFDDSAECAPPPVQQDGHGEEDAGDVDDLLAEIRREEQESAEALRRELEADKAAAAKQAADQAATKKKKIKKKKGSKKKSAKKEL